MQPDVNVSSSDLPCKDGKARFTTVDSWNFYLINNEDDIVIFLGLTMFKSNDFFKWFTTFVEKLQLKIISLKN